MSTTAKSQILTEQENEIVLSPNVSLFCQLDQKPSDTTPVFLKRVRDNTNLPLDRIRLLTNKSIQLELDLDEAHKAGIRKISPSLEQFETQDKWDYYAAPESVSKNARARAKKLLDGIEAFRSDHPDLNWERLEQIRWQFACIGTNRNPRAESPIKFVRSKLALSETQRNLIQEIVKEELGDLLTFESFFAEIAPVLSPVQKTLFEQYMQPFTRGSAHPAFAMGHCQDLLVDDSDEANANVEGEIPLVICETIIFTPIGQLAIDSEYLRRESIRSTARPWRRTLDSIRLGEMSWLELTKDQNDKLSALRIIKKLDDGRSSLSYYGSEVFKTLEGPPTKDWTSAQYRKWDEDFRRLTREADELLGKAISDILLPNQLDAIKTALAISKVPELGPIHVMEHLTKLELSPKQREQVKTLRRDRLVRLQAKFSEIDQRCRRELSVEQREWQMKHIGPLAKQYPCIWLFL